MEFFKTLIKYVFLIIFYAIIGLLLAFPVKWCWNYVMPYVFNLPLITWGHAWCLNFLSGMLIQSSLSHASSSKE